MKILKNENCFVLKTWTREISKDYLKEMINFTKEELDILKKIGINPENLKTRWQWVNEKTAISFYRDVIYPHFNRVLNRDEIDNIGYRGFRSAVKRIDKTLNRWNIGYDTIMKFFYL